MPNGCVGRAAGPRDHTPRRGADVQELIATLSREIGQWRTERIRSELLELGIVVSNRFIRRHRGRGPVRPANQTWRTFLHNHANCARQPVCEAGSGRRGPRITRM